MFELIVLDCNTKNVKSKIIVRVSNLKSFQFLHHILCNIYILDLDMIYIIGALCTQITKRSNF